MKSVTSTRQDSIVSKNFRYIPEISRNKIGLYFLEVLQKGLSGLLETNPESSVIVIYSGEHNYNPMEADQLPKDNFRHYSAKGRSLKICATWKHAKLYSSNT